MSDLVSDSNQFDAQLKWRLALHEQLTDHPFEQDENDIPGGCKTCWQRLENADEN